jgi:hypothetical protein
MCSVRLTDVLFASAASPRSSRSGCLALPVLSPRTAKPRVWDTPSTQLRGWG